MKKADLADESDSARSAVWYCCKFLAGVLRILFFGSLILLIAIVLSRLGERPMEPWGGGGTYIRWGRTSCPETPGTELVYQGRAAGSFYDHRGGGANYLCVTMEPQSGKFHPGDSSKHVSLLYGKPEKVDGGHANHDGALFLNVEPRCGSLPCPPYDNTKEMTCVVCSK
ncbi:hypothetical protein GBAR_LOCUS8916 [Geodia barretti]|uniref:Uncharacterized protein n=1 Tax=Geodia barretti TaxID=519541 RepID=A0AA35RMF5_GEOBA|nr:hypothetical protein GBAR_LOCUS8916 [Geodia barretti]